MLDGNAGEFFRFDNVRRWQRGYCGASDSYAGARIDTACWVRDCRIGCEEVAQTLGRFPTERIKLMLPAPRVARKEPFGAMAVQP